MMEVPNPSMIDGGTVVPAANCQAAGPRRSTVAGALRDAFWEISYSLASLLFGRRSHRQR